MSYDEAPARYSAIGGASVSLSGIGPIKANNGVIELNLANAGSGQSILHSHVAGSGLIELKTIAGSGSVVATTVGGEIRLTDQKANIGAGQDVYVPGPVSQFRRLFSDDDSITITSDGSTNYLRANGEVIQVSNTGATVFLMDPFSTPVYKDYIEWEVNDPLTTFDPLGYLSSPQTIRLPRGVYQVNLNIVFLQDGLAGSGIPDNASHLWWALEDSGGQHRFRMAIHPAGNRENSVCRSELIYSQGEEFRVFFYYENTFTTCNLTLPYGESHWSFTRLYANF